MKTRIISALLSAVICTAGICGSLTSLTSSAVSYNIAGDVNGDGALSSSDILLMEKHVLGAEILSAEYAKRADMNSDGKVNSFDVIDWREQYSYNATKRPTGTWIVEGFDGTRLFYFGSDSKGRYSDTVTTESKSFTLNTNGNEITLALDNASSEKAAISWIDDTHFSLKWDATTSEIFTYVNDANYYSGPYLCGTFVSSDGTEYKMNSYSAKTDSGTVTIVPMGKKAMFIDSKGNRKTGNFSRSDKYHFTLQWQDGTTEKFTRREIEVDKGIVYVNGILIANKSFALPSNYNPGALTSETLAAYNAMAADAKAQGKTLRITSGYRSYSYQSQLYQSYINRDGQTAADTYSARPGHSEHQTGMAIDVGGSGDIFEYTPESPWLAQNCYKYGFIIRYPKGKENITGYMYEPWHIRYIGKENAELVYRSGLCLEEYLGINSYYH